MEAFFLDGKEIRAEVLGNPAADSPLAAVYCLAGDGFGEYLAEIRRAVLPGLREGAIRPFLLTWAGPADWNRDFSPWPAPALGKGGKPFSGGAPAFLDWTAKTWMPELRKRFPLGTDPADNLLLGYSLGGLCALWMVHETALFGGCASCSGSLWFDGWTDYQNAHGVQVPRSRIYLSLGRKEERARNPRMAAVGNATRAAFLRLEQQKNITSCVLEWQEGGHFTNVPRRLAQALLWLMEDLCALPQTPPGEGT